MLFYFRYILDSTIRAQFVNTALPPHGAHIQPMSVPVVKAMGNILASITENVFVSEQETTNDLVTQSTKYRTAV